MQKAAAHAQFCHSFGGSLSALSLERLVVLVSIWSTDSAFVSYVIEENAGSLHHAVKYIRTDLQLPLVHASSMAKNTKRILNYAARP